MLINIKYFFFVFTFLGLTSFVNFKTEQNKSWELKKNSDGISIYTRNSEGSDFKELKSVMQLKTSLSSIVALLNDWENYPKWVYKCEKSITLKKISDTEVIHYQTVIAPWPADNRDFIVDVKISQNPLSNVVTQKAICLSNYIPQIKEYVRITEFKASWILTPIKNGMVNIEYHLLVNPGGSLPAWIVNLAMIDGPFETNLNLKEWVKKEKISKTKD